MSKKNSKEKVVVCLEGESSKKMDDVILEFEILHSPVPVDSELLKTLLNSYREQLIPVHIFRNIKRVEKISREEKKSLEGVFWLLLFIKKDGTRGGVLLKVDPDSTTAIGYWKRQGAEKMTRERILETIAETRNAEAWKRLDLIIGYQ